MKRLFLSTLLVLFLLVNIIPCQAASQLKIYSLTEQAAQQGQIIWKFTGLGKTTEDMVMAPNGNLLIPAGGKLICVDSNGRILWENKTSGGNMGRLVALDNGSIFSSSGSTIQETKFNGANGWSCSIFSAAKAAKATMLAGGPNSILYMPMPDALYGINTSGHYTWMLSPWDSSQASASKVLNPYTFLDCTTDKQAFYAVCGENKGSYKIAAIDTQGKKLWTYWLGDVISAHLLADGKGQLFLVATFKDTSSGNSSGTDKLNISRVYCFRSENGKSVWQSTYSITDEMTAPCLVGNDVLYVTGGNKIHALDAGKGTRLWDYTLLNLVSPPIVSLDGQRIYAGSSDNVLYAVNNTGRLAWSRNLDGAIERVPVSADGSYIYVMTQKGTLYKLLDNVK
ncbi:MAG: PQQ-binding-like beta-propeller repeat protein [Syntrophomonas sp.]